LKYVQEVDILSEKILGILSEGLSLATEALHLALTASTPGRSQPITLRTNFYGLKEDGEAVPGVVHAHSDPGGLTTLLADDVPGLEVKRNDKWVKVDPILGAFIVNIGDQIEVFIFYRFNEVTRQNIVSAVAAYLIWLCIILNLLTSDDFPVSRSAVMAGTRA
jgi:isopenicillin N synthase-like dioxygenase